MSKWIIIGAGPAGISSAIVLAKRGYTVDVYDRVSDLKQNDEDSYPIGLNPRGMKALDNLDNSGELRNIVASETPIDCWNIYKGKKRIVSFPSGTTVGATRSSVTFCLFEEAISKYNTNINFYFNYKLVSVDFNNKELTFNINNEENKTIDASDCRIIAADGVWSKVRTQYEQICDKNEFITTSQNWDCSFRLLFSKENVKSELNAREHHIFASGIYAAVVNSEKQKWVVAVQISKSNPHADILLSNNNTEENRNILKKYIEENAPYTFSMIPDEEFEKYFSRRSFSGSVISTSTLNINEWILFLGDSAHSVYPAIGEGINCALEDSEIFDNAFDNCSINELFTYYNNIRIKDTNAVTEYARYLVTTSTDRQSKISSTISTIILQICKKFGLVKSVWNDKSFGVSANEIEPYSNLLETWKHQQKYISPFSNVIGYSIDFILRKKEALFG